VNLLKGFLVQLVDVVPDDGVARAVEEKDSATEDAVQGREGAVQSYVLKISINFASKLCASSLQLLLSVICNLSLLRKATDLH
jgi:hypothetical protein